MWGTERFDSRSENSPVNPMTWVQALQGTALIVGICGLLFIEEVGVPLPFAPGDLVLAIGGIAIAGGRVNPAWFVASVTAAVLIGAILGREITALLGWERLMRLAAPLHAQKPLERVSGVLQRGGWRAVFTARLIPGLRVYTTQVAGVSGVSRSTFVAGMVPATLVYVGAFVGLGAAFGRPILALIHEAEHQALIAIGLVLAAVVIFLLTREPGRRALASLQAAGWTGPLRFRLDSVGVVLIFGSIGLNFAGRALAVTFNLPLFLDSTGTIVAGVVGGPWIGGSVGFISNLLSSNTIDPVAAPYGIVSFAVGFAAGLSRYLNWQRRIGGWIALWLVCFLVAALMSTPLNFLMSGGKTSVAFGDSVYAALSAAHLPNVLAAFGGEAAVDLPDKLITVVAALLIAGGMPQMATSRAVDLDLARAFTFVVRSPHWLRKLLAAAACLLFIWLVIPYLVLAGYIVEIARSVKHGGRELPSWDDRWSKVIDGFKIVLVIAIWTVPAALLSIPAAIVEAARGEGSTQAMGGAIAAGAGLVAAVGSVWGVAVLLLEAAIISEFINHGFWGALNPGAVGRRLRVNLGLSIVIGVLIVALSTVGVIGLGAFVIGVFVTYPYAAYVGGYLVGEYARLTDAHRPEPPPRRSRERGIVVSPAGGPTLP
jgi:membrane protein DedA with SNARE-associated domain